MKIKRLISNVANNKKIVTFILLFILILSVLLFSYNKGSDNVTIDDVSLKKINNKSKMFAIMISENDGSDYHECSSEICNNSIFPGVAYIYQKSVCLDDKGETVDNALTFDSNTRKATVKSNKTLYCTLYFNKDTQVPILNTFYINTQDTNKYTNTNTVTIHMAWSDNDVKEYCVTNENNTSNCTWNPTNGALSLDDISYTLTQSGLNTLYGFIRDNANNVSLEKHDSITYDTGKPVIKEFKLGSAYTNGTTVTFTLTSDDKDIKEWCVITTNDVTRCTWQNNNTAAKNVTISGNEGTKVYYAFLKDNAGNTSNVTGNTATKNESIIYDKTAPTVNRTSTKATAGVTGATITVVVDDVKGTGADATSGIKEYCYSMNATSGYKCNNYSTVKTFTIDKDGNNAALKPSTTYTYYVYAIDNAGNGTMANRDTLTFTTEKPAGSYVDDKVSGNVGTGSYGPSGATGITDPLTKRFSGRNPNNYICFGAGSCSSGDDHMYRIIGATSDGKLKIIKQTKLSNNQPWHSSTGVTWEGAQLRSDINDKLFYNDTNLVPADYKQYIDPAPSWCMGNVTHNLTGSTVLT